MSSPLRRRELLQCLGAGMAGAASVGTARAGEAAATRPAVGTIKDLPTRKLGRIGIRVPVLSFGSAPMGHAFYRAEPFEEVTLAAIEAGITYIDTAPVYDVAQERLGPIVAKHRKELFLVTKSMGRTRDDVLRDIDKSLAHLQTDHADLAHLHNIGQHETEHLLGKGGALEGMLEAKKRGWIRHIGGSGHLRPARFLPVIETGEIDLLMLAMNFVDRHTYNFEERVLPAARKHGCAIVCMKVLGGVTGSWDGYKKRRPGRLVSDEYRQMAFDYALSIPDVSTLVVGMKSLEELRLIIAAARAARPLDGERLAQVIAKGKELAAEWGEHFGPVT